MGGRLNGSWQLLLPAIPVALLHARLSCQALKRMTKVAITQQVHGQGKVDQAKNHLGGKRQVLINMLSGTGILQF